MSNRTMLEWAYCYFNLGWNLLPIRENSKLPAIQWKEYQSRRVIAEELKTWFENSNYNMALLCGDISDTSIIDIDYYKKPNIELPNFPDTPLMVRTPRGGQHLYYAFNQNIKNAQVGLVDIRNEGGYVLLPPSKIDGKSYEWVTPFDPFGVTKVPDLPPFPLGLIEELKKPRQEKQTIEGIKEGYRNVSLFKYLCGRLNSLDEGEAWALALYKNLTFQPPLTEGEVKTIFESALAKVRGNHKSSQSPARSSYPLITNNPLTTNDKWLMEAVDSELTKSKPQIIADLKNFNYRTSPLKVSRLLEAYFYPQASKNGHWLYIAQHYPPRTICRVLDAMVKAEREGRVVFENRPAYFTKLISFRKKRRSIPAIGGSKQHKGGGEL